MLELWLIIFYENIFKTFGQIFIKFNIKCQPYSNSLKVCTGQIYDNGADMVGKEKDVRP